MFGFILNTLAGAYAVTGLFLYIVTGYVILSLIGTCLLTGLLGIALFAGFIRRWQEKYYWKAKKFKECSRQMPAKRWPALFKERGYILKSGVITRQDTSQSLSCDEEIVKAYLGDR